MGKKKGLSKCPSCDSGNIKQISKVDYTCPDCNKQLKATGEWAELRKEDGTVVKCPKCKSTRFDLTVFENGEMCVICISCNSIYTWLKEVADV